MSGYGGYEREELIQFVSESNRIESITYNSDSDVEAHARLLALDVVTVSDMERFVMQVAGAILRDRPGLNVRIGQHVPPPGGFAIRTALSDLLVTAAQMGLTARAVHVQYETLHPFTDGNGRSGRALWAWQMLRENRWPGIRLGFLHAFYYQSLQESRA